MAAVRVLVVEDEELFRPALCRILSRAGYDVLPATGPRQALEIIKNESRIDVLLSDVTMPEMLGTDLVRAVAHVSPQTAPVLMTGWVTSSAEIPDGVPLLRKPFSTQVLLAAVQVALVRSTQLREQLASAREKSADARLHSEELRLEFKEAVRDAAETRRKSQDLVPPKDKS
jgi:DNA-binding NtrC family response regulator